MSVLLGQLFGAGVFLLEFAMPVAPLKPCSQPSCGRLVKSGKCDLHKKNDDRVRGTRTERGYNNRWLKARETYLRRSPLCVKCKEAGRLTPARIVDHIIPHNGDQDLFWDSENNWQSLCRSCHSRKTASEDGGFGNPIRQG
jgi:5-methylcytosine-specific restriction protein A